MVEARSNYVLLCVHGIGGIESGLNNKESSSVSTILSADGQDCRNLDSCT